MKVYFIKLIMDGHKTDVIRGFTDSKSLCDKFIETRKKSLFYVTSKKMTDDEFREIETELIDYKLMVTYGTYTRYEGKVQECEIVCTLDEYRRTNMFINEEISNIAGPYNDLAFLKDKYVDALNTLIYSKLKKLVTHPEYGDSEVLYTSDFLTAFIELYGDEMKL